jgi:DNA-binding transcriptional MerR regulator
MEVNMTYYTVKQVAEQYNVSTHTIRFYDDQGLLPGVTRDEHGTRLFTKENLDWMSLILCLRNTGMPIVDIKHYINLCLEGDNTVLERHGIIMKQKKKAEADLKETQHRLEVLNMKEKCYEQHLLNNRIACNPASEAAAN